MKKLSMFLLALIMLLMVTTKTNVTGMLMGVVTAMDGESGSEGYDSNMTPTIQGAATTSSWNTRSLVESGVQPSHPPASERSEAMGDYLMHLQQDLYDFYGQQVGWNAVWEWRMMKINYKNNPWEQSIKSGGMPGVSSDLVMHPWPMSPEKWGEYESIMDGILTKVDKLMEGQEWNKEVERYPMVLNRACLAKGDEVNEIAEMTIKNKMEEMLEKTEIALANEALSKELENSPENVILMMQVADSGDIKNLSSIKAKFECLAVRSMGWLWGNGSY